MKKKKRIETDTAWYQASHFFWCRCPYCKKMLIFQPKMDKTGRKALQEWKKIKIKVKTEKRA